MVTFADVVDNLLTNGVMKEVTDIPGLDVVSEANEAAVIGSVTAVYIDGIDCGVVVASMGSDAVCPAVTPAVV